MGVLGAPMAWDALSRDKTPMEGMSRTSAASQHPAKQPLTVARSLHQLLCQAVRGSCKLGGAVSPEELNLRAEPDALVHSGFFQQVFLNLGMGVTSHSSCCHHPISMHPEHSGNEP